MKHFLFGLVLTALAFVGSAEAASRFGVCSVTCTWDSSSTAMWSATSGGATGASVPGASDTVTFDANTCVGGVTCTITVNFGGTITIQSLTMGACTASTTGCIFDNSVNNNNITVTATGTPFNGSGSGTRTYKLGTATYTLSAGSPTASFSTASNLTCECSSSTFSFTGDGSRTFLYGGTLTFGTVSVSAAASTGFFKFTRASGSVTFGNLNVTAPNYIVISALTTVTITNAVNIAGSSSNQIGFTSDSVSNASGLSVGTSSTFQWSAFRDILFTGSPTITNSFNLGGNSGATITGPSTGGGSCIFGGWLLWGDIRGDNDNWPAFLDKAG